VRFRLNRLFLLWICEFGRRNRRGLERNYRRKGLGFGGRFYWSRNGKGRRSRSLLRGLRLRERGIFRGAYGRGGLRQGYGRRRRRTGSKDKTEI
jgi:hypothetical protein